MGEPRATRPGFPSGYGIHTDDAGLLEWNWAAERLVAERQYWLATVRADGRPHLAPVWGVWVDGRFWFGTDAGSVKGCNLERDPRCSVSTESGIETVILEGEAHRRDHAEVPAVVTDAYFEKYDVQLDPALGPLYEVRPRVAVGFRETEFPETATRWSFE